MASDEQAQTKSERLRQHLVAVIDAGLEPHERLPTERDLADTFEVSRLTVRRALDRLERDGRVYRVQGAGTFVSEPRITKSLELTSFSEDMRARGLQPGSRLARVATVPAGARIGYALGLSPAEEVLHVQRVRMADDAPMCLEDVYIPRALVPGLEDFVGTDSLYDSMEQRYGLVIDRADQIIRATVLDPAVAALLEAPAFSPAFQVERTGFDDRSRAIEFAESLYRGDRYSYEISVFRRSGASA